MYPWQRGWDLAYPCSLDEVDEEYWRFCVRLLEMAKDWEKDGLEPTTRNLDTYLLGCAGDWF